MKRILGAAAVAALVAVGVGVVPSPAHATTLSLLVADNLNNPRQVVAFGNKVFVAETGTGGDPSGCAADQPCVGSPVRSPPSTTTSRTGCRTVSSRCRSQARTVVRWKWLALTPLPSTVTSSTASPPAAASSRLACHRRSPDNSATSCALTVATPSSHSPTSATSSARTTLTARKPTPDRYGIAIRGARSTSPTQPATTS